MSDLQEQYKPAHIQLDSEDRVYEWHVDTDRLFLSRGACEALHLAPDEITTFSEFSSRVPDASVDSMQNRLSMVMRIRDCPVHEFVFPFDEEIVHSSTIVLRRDEKGLATVIVGALSVNEEAVSYKPAPAGNIEAAEGFWRVDLKNRSVQLDCACGAMLGFDWSGPAVLPLAEFESFIHPSDLEVSRRHHRLLEDSDQWGERFTDHMRLRLADGTYESFYLNGSTLERDADGKVVECVGTMRPSGVRGVKSARHTGNILLAVSSSGDGVWDWDLTTGSVNYSPRYIAMLGYTEDEFPQVFESWASRIHPDDREKIVDLQFAVASAPKYGDSFECVYRLLKADGTYAWIMGRGYVTQRDANGKAMRIVGLHTDITAAQSDRERIEEQLRNDSLTGARSRSFFMSEMERLEKIGKRPVSIVMCDVDGLKLVNDHLGHEEGDELITSLVRLIKLCMDPTDCVARLGGDEFVLLLTTCGEDEARELVEVIKNEIRVHNTSDIHVPIHASFGLSCTTSTEDSLRDAMLRADKLMLEHKRRHRARFHEKIRAYIERRLHRTISLEDERC